MSNYDKEDIEKISAVAESNKEISRNNLEIAKAKRDVELANVRRVSKILNVIALAVGCTSFVLVCLIFKLL